MASRIQTRLKALEVVCNKAGEEGQGEQKSEMAEYERRACLLVAHYQHRALGVPIDSLLPHMLRHVDESEARRLLAMDYNSIHRAVGMPDHTATKPASQARPAERVLPRVQLPGGRHRAR